MRNINPGSIFFFIFLFIVANNMFGGIPFLLPMILFFVVYNFVSKKKDASRDRGHVRESTKRRRARAQDQRDYSRNRRRQQAPQRPVRRKPVIKKNPFKKSGVDKFKDFDYEGAIEDFSRALQIDGKDPAVFFNLACAYSLTEQKDEAFDALSKASMLGFKDFDKIKTHDALAFLRVQEEFDQFVAGGYRWPLSGNRNPLPEQQSELLQQLKQLAALREKGLLTDEEFLSQKKRLLN